MTVLRILGSAALLAIAMAGGWMLNEHFSAPPSPALQRSLTSEAPHPPTSSTPAESSPALSVFSYPRHTSEPEPQSDAPASKSSVTLFRDGTVTIHVQKRPWRWVLEEIARQENARTTGAGNASAPAHREASTSEEQAQQQALLETIKNGDEAARYEALLNARSTGTVVTNETLKQLFEIDSSERVRLLAFENYLERISGNAAEVRAAAEAALYLPSPMIQAEARRLLEHLDEQERSNADDAQAQAQAAGS